MRLTFLVAAFALFVASSANAQAVVTYYADPVTSYYTPYTSYYSPVTSYYGAAPVTSYYTPYTSYYSPYYATPGQVRRAYRRGYW